MVAPSGRWRLLDAPKAADLGDQSSPAGAAAAAADATATAPAAALPPPVDLQTLRPLGSLAPVHVALHPNWCTPHPSMPYSAYGEVMDSFTAWTAEAVETGYRAELQPIAHAEGRRILSVTADCQLSVPRRDWDRDEIVCVLRHNAWVRCARAQELHREAQRWEPELMPETVLRPVCLRSTREWDAVVAGAGDRDAAPVLDVSVNGIAVPLPSWMPRAWCRPLFAAMPFLDDPILQSRGYGPVTVPMRGGPMPPQGGWPSD